MSIIYPLTLPASPGFSRCVFRSQNIVGMSKSPFTGSQQVYQWPGEWWEADCTLPQMNRADAENWAAFLLKLRGGSGTFLMGDPAGKTAQGAAPGNFTAPMTTFLANQTGTTFKWWGLPANQTNSFKAGDYFQICENLLGSTRLIPGQWTGVNTGFTFTANAQVDPIGNTTAGTYVAGASGGDLVTDHLESIIQPLSGRTFTFMIWAKLLSGSGQTHIRIKNGGVFMGNTNFTPTANWGRYTVSATYSSSDTAITCEVFVDANTSVAMWGPTLYDPLNNGRLHKILSDTSSDAGGAVQPDIFPRLRESPVNYSAVLIDNPVGTFRLAANDAQWDVDAARMYGMAFKAIEAI